MNKLINISESLFKPDLEHYHIDHLKLGLARDGDCSSLT